MKEKLFMSALAMSLVASTGWAQTNMPTEQQRGNLEPCVALVQETMGGETTHLEFESRNGQPIYEFTVQSEAGPTYYVGCNATTGLLGQIDVIVSDDDERFASGAKLNAQQAADTATRLYSGEVEEVKALLLATGQAVYEVDVEFEPEGEVNVYVDAESGNIVAVNVEYWEIGQSETAANQLSGSGASEGSGGDGN